MTASLAPIPTITAPGSRQKLFRVAPDLELRSGGDGRTVVGIAVPFNKPQRINDDLVEAFDPHVFDHQIRAIHRVGYWNLHSIHNGVKVGHIKEARADASGFYTESYIARGEDGDRAIDEIKAGKRPQQSVGFESIPTGNEFRDGVTWRMKSDLFELAAVPIGAFGASASVAEVRAAVCAECGQPLDPQQHRAVASRRRAVADMLAGLPKL